MTKAQRQLLLDMQAELKTAGRWHKALDERFNRELVETRSREVAIRLSGKQPRLFEE